MGRAVLALVLVYCSLCCNGVCSAGGEGDTYNITVRQHNAVATRHDDLVCIGYKLDPEEAYVVSFTPHANKTTAHHMMVYGCSVPANPDYEHSWQCPHGDYVSDIHGVCGHGSRQIIFAWALDAPSKVLPPGVGFRVSGDTGINYLVLQLHYANKFAEGATDSSGVTLTMTKKRPAQQVGYLVLGNMGFIPPHQSAFHMESFCNYSRDYPIYPIGYRTHAHNLDVVTSGYRIRDGNWTEIGRMSPQLPQTFYNVTHPGMAIRPGDSLAARCTMNSMGRQEATRIGPENHDEMCNFYIMYSTYNQETLRTDYCFSDAQRYHWSNNLDPDNFPPKASSLEGIPEADAVRAFFHLKPRRRSVM